MKLIRFLTFVSFIVLVILKLTNAATITWWIVFSPLILMGSIAVLVMVIGIIAIWANDVANK